MTFKSKRNKIILIWTLMLSGSILLAGCGKKASMTADEFTAKMEEIGYEVSSNSNMEAIPRMLSKENIQASVVAFKIKNRATDRVQLIIFHNTKDAKAGYNEIVENASANVQYMKATFQGMKTDAMEIDTIEIKETGNPDKFVVEKSVLGEMRYTSLSRIENTILLVDVPKAQAEELEAVFEGMGD